MSNETGTETTFDKLMQDMDDAGLDRLTQALSRVTAERRQATAVKLEDIHPNMAESDRQRVQQHIARVLRGEE